MSTRKRQRVPVSCVVCKKRKVKCDQSRPVCGGCQKNGVPHLCRYLDPHWSSDLKKSTPIGDIGTNGKLVEQGQLRSQVVNDELNITIESQRSQIEDLKRRLALAQNNSTPNSGIGNNDITQLYTLTNVTILHKIRPKSKTLFKVANDMSFAVEKITPGVYVDVYSYPNSAKLDPKLANLWSKISKLQHLYKSFKLKPHGMETTVEPEGSMEPENTLETCPVMQMDLDGIPEPPRFDDLALSLQTSSLGDSEEATRALQPKYNWPSPQLIYPPGNLAQQNQADRTLRETLVREADFSTKSVTVILAWQKVWASTLKLLKGGVKLKYDQASFLLNYFFTNVPSRGILKIYEQLIKDMIMDSGSGDVRLKTNRVDSSSLSAFDTMKLNASLMIMVSVAMRFSLQHLRQRLNPLVKDNKFIDKFKDLFPSEVELYKEPPPDNINLMYEQLEALNIIWNLRLNPPATNRLETLPFYAACIFFIFNAYYDDNYNRNPKAIATFGKVFNLYLSAITKTEDVIIWNDPANVIYLGSPESSPELSNHVWLLWHETVHLVNLVVFGLPGYLKLSDSLGKLAMTALGRIISSDSDGSHSNYIGLIRHHRELITNHETSSLDIDFLISRICFTLAKGTEGSQVPISKLLAFSKEIAVYLIKDYEFTRDDISYCCYLERQISLRYLRFFLAYLLLLQYEDDQRTGTTKGDGDAIILSLSVKLISLLGFIRNELSYLDKSSDGYPSRILYELAIRISPPMCGYILRVYEMKDELRSKIAKIIDEEFPGEFKEYGVACAKIVALLNSMINQFKYLHGDKTCLLSKTWRFYLIFIKNLNKIEKSDFTKMHANLSFFKVNNTNGQEARANGDEKKCPVDHESLMKRGRKISAKESNIRERKTSGNLNNNKSNNMEQSIGPDDKSRDSSESTESYMNDNLPWRLFLTFFELQQGPISSPMLELFQANEGSIEIGNNTAGPDPILELENLDILPGVLSDFALFDVDIDFDVISQQIVQESGSSSTL